MILSENQIRSAVMDVVPRYAIKKVELFGSYADDRATDQSDVDFLVEFIRERVSLLELNHLKYELEDILGKTVDVVHGPLDEKSILDIQTKVKLYE